MHLTYVALHEVTDMVHGWVVYTERAEAGGSSFTLHQPCQRCKYITARMNRTVCTVLRRRCHHVDHFLISHEKQKANSQCSVCQMTSPLYLRAGILRQVKLAYQILKWKNNVFVHPISKLPSDDLVRYSLLTYCDWIAKWTECTYSGLTVG